MTISSTNRKAGPYAGNDVAVAFPFSFKVFSASDLYIVRADSTGAETVLTLAVDYTVSLNSNQDSNPGGTITLPSALASGYTLTVASQMQYLQPTDLTNQGGFYPSVITNALDRLTIFVQQLSEAGSRSLKTAISTPSGVSYQLPAPVPYALIGWNSDGTGFQNTDPTYSTALATDLASSSSGKGGALVAFKQPLVGAIARTLFDKCSEIVSVKDFGAKGDGVTNDTAAIQAASNAASGKTLVFPPGTYKVVNGFDISGDNTTIIGYSATLSYQKTTATYYHCIRLLGNNCRIEGLRIQSPGGLVRGDTCFGISLGSAATATENIVIENCVIDAVASAGIWVTNVTNVIITGCHIVNCLADGIHFADGCYGITVDSNVLRANGDDNIAIVNDVTGPPFVGRFVVSNNDIEGGTAVSGHGVALIGASCGVVIGNIISNTRAAAVGTYQWADTSENTSGLTITGNRIVNCGAGGTTFGGCGISLRQSANVVVNNNHITNLTYDAAKVCGGINAASSTRLVVSGNTFDDNACDQVVITGAAEALISGNTFGYGAREGVVISNSVSLAIVKDNTFTGTAGTNDVNINLPSGTVRCYNNSLTKSVAITASVSTIARNEIEGFTPTVTATSGSITSASAALTYQRAGRFLFVYLSISVHNNGTGAGKLTVTLPFAANGVLSGRENAIGGAQVNGIAAGTASIAVSKYDNSYPAVNGSSFVLSGVLIL